jgi:hypothetical protein
MRASPWFLIMAVVAACSAPGASTASREPVACVLDAQPELIPVSNPIEGELNEAFDLPDAPEWWAPAPRDAERERYRATLAARLGGEPALLPRALLERSRDVHAAMRSGSAREAENSSALLEGKAGTLGPISCLEWRLFQRQARRFPMIEHPTEFGAYVLRGHGRIRVYLSGADLVGGKLRGEVRDRVLAEVGRGFAPVAHGHNHNFMLDRRPGDRMWTTEESVNDVGGALAPSLTDVQAWRRMREHFGLQGAWVTNGLDTARYTAEDFDRLSAWP